MADRIEMMIDRLSAGMPGVIWERDAADVARPEDWGAVELRSGADVQWSDGQPTDEATGIDVYLCVTDREAGWLDTVETILRAYDDEVAWITWALADRVWLPEIQHTMWRWRVTLYEPILTEG